MFLCFSPCTPLWTSHRAELFYRLPDGLSHSHTCNVSKEALILPEHLEDLCELLFVNGIPRYQQKAKYNNKNTMWKRKLKILFPAMQAENKTKYFKLSMSVDGERQFQCCYKTYWDVYRRKSLTVSHLAGVKVQAILRVSILSYLIIAIIPRVPCMLSDNQWS